jgi:hypothetical protein
VNATLEHRTSPRKHHETQETQVKWWKELEEEEEWTQVKWRKELEEEEEWTLRALLLSH